MQLQVRVPKSVSKLLTLVEECGGRVHVLDASWAVWGETAPASAVHKLVRRARQALCWSGSDHVLILDGEHITVRARERNGSE